MSAIKHKSLCFLFVIFASLFTFYSRALADSPTIVTESIETDTTWTIENSPYVIENDIYIFSDATLTINPGVVVKFNHPSLWINVSGSIAVNGNSSSLVTFTLSEDALDGNDDTYGIYINDTKGKSTFSYANFEYESRLLLDDNPEFLADNLNFSGLGGGNISSTRSTATLSNINNSTFYISNNSNFTVDHFTSDNLSNAIRLNGESSLKMSDSSILNTKGVAIDAYYKCSLTLTDVSISNTLYGESISIVYDSTLNATNLNIDESSKDALAIFDFSAAVLNNSTLTNNNGYFGAVDIYNGSSLSATESVFYGGLANGFNVSAGSTLILSDSTVKNFLGSGIKSLGSGWHTIPDIVSIKNSTITENDIGIDIYSDPDTVAPTEVDISGNFIHDNFSFGAQISAGIPVLLFLNNWWGDKTGPYHEALNPNGLGDPVSDFISFTPFCKNDTCTTRNPVIIVPGLLGTEIFKPTEGGSEKLWLDLAHNLADIGDEFMDILQFNNDLTPLDVTLTIGDVIGKLPTLDYSDGLMKEFEKQGYVEGEDLFLFPYDWRYGVSEDNVNKLKQKITDVLEQTDATKVDIVAHSMGGLITKKYVVENAANSHIAKAIFVGVPNTGSPKAVKALLQGDGNLLTADEEMKKLSKNMPAAYDLLPSKKYFDVKGSFIKIISKPLFASVPKDLSFAEMSSFLTDDHALNAKALENAENLHTEDFDNYDIRTTGIDLYAIDGCTAGTIGKVVEVRPDPAFNDPASPSFKPNPVPEYQLEYTPGDATVPLESATNLPINQENKFYSLKGKHADMLTGEGVRQKIVNIISGSSLSTKDAKGADVITQDIAKCKLDGRAISVFSPLSISVLDQDGNHVGISSDGVSIENNIPNADFNIIGEHKFVYLPTDAGQTYTISVAGTGTGTFTITDATISSNNVTQTQVFSNISVTPSLLGSVVISNNTNTNLLLDTDGNGTTDQTLTPTSVLDASQSQNFVPEPPANDPPPQNTSTSSGSGASPVSHGGGHAIPVTSQIVTTAQASSNEVPIPVVVQAQNETTKETQVAKVEKPKKLALSKSKNIENKELVQNALIQAESLPEGSELTASVAESAIPIENQVAVGALAGIALFLLAKRFIKL